MGTGLRENVKLTVQEVEAAARQVYAVMPPTPQYAWPLLAQRTGCEVWVKHENHTPAGAFKVRGGIIYLSNLKARDPGLKGVIAATRGNHGQSVAWAATRHGVPSTVVVPHGNSREKNAAMQAFGADLIVHGQDFQDALEHARRLAEERRLHLVPPFHDWLVAGVATYALELFRAVSDLHTVYVPIGMGSGICAVIAVRDALGLKTRVVGVVTEALPCYRLSFERGEPVATPPADTIADGMACRVPDADALERIQGGADRVVAVGEADIRAAMRHYFTDTHNVVEGAGAAPLAALLAEREQMRGRRVGLIVTGGNVDADVFARVLSS